MAIDKILENVVRYIESRFELFKLEVEESVSTAAVKLIQGLVVGVFSTLVLLFLSIGLANLLNVWLKSAYLGHFILAGFYLVLMLGIVSSAGEKKLKEKIEANMSQVFEKRKNATAEAQPTTDSTDTEI